MNATAPSSVQQPAYLLKIVGGPDKGASYKIMSGKVTLGRDSGNDINLKDQRCSHHHAAVVIQGHQLFVKDIGSRNGILVNGKKVTEAVVKLGDQVQLGDTIFVLQKETPMAMPGLTTTSSPVAYSGPMGVVPPSGFPRPGAPPMTQMSAQGAPRRVRESNPTTVIVGVALIGLVAFLVIGPGSKKKKADYGLKTEEQVTAEIADIEKQKTELMRQKVSSGQMSEQFKEAQAAYLQGFRDYREGNYNRAIQSFTASLALLPDHVLAQKYKGLAERRLDELVQFNLMEGKRNMEQNRYEMARANYRSVTILLNDKNSKLYQEASAQLQFIETLLTGRY